MFLMSLLFALLIVWWTTVVVSSGVVDGFQSLVLTSLLARLVFVLKASLGVTLRNLLSIGMLVSMIYQCLYTILNALLAPCDKSGLL